jgi:hypothetical protein
LIEEMNPIENGLRLTVRVTTGYIGVVQDGPWAIYKMG